MKHLPLIIIGILYTLTSCKDTETATNPSKTNKIYSNEDKMFMLLTKSSTNNKYPTQYITEEDYSLAIYDQKQDHNGNTLIAIGLGNSYDKTITQANNIKDSVQLLKTIKPKSSLRIYDQCCVPASFEAPQEHRDMIYTVINDLDIDILEPYIFDTCSKISQLKQ